MTPPPVDSLNHYGFGDTVVQKRLEVQRQRFRENKQAYEMLLKHCLYSEGEISEEKLHEYQKQYPFGTEVYQNIQGELIRRFKLDKESYQQIYGQAIQRTYPITQEDEQRLKDLATELDLGEGAVRLIIKEYRDRARFEALQQTSEQAKCIEQHELPDVSFEEKPPSPNDLENTIVPPPTPLPEPADLTTVSPNPDIPVDPKPSQKRSHSILNWSIWLGSSALGLAGAIALIAFFVRFGGSGAYLVQSSGLLKVQRQAETLLPHQINRESLLNSLLQGREELITKTYEQMFLAADKSYQEGNLDEGCALAAQIPGWSSSRSDAQNIVARCNVEQPILDAFSQAYSNADWDVVIEEAQKLRSRGVPYYESNIREQHDEATSQRLPGRDESSQDLGRDESYQDLGRDESYQDPGRDESYQDPGKWDYMPGGQQQ